GEVTLSSLEAVQDRLKEMRPNLSNIDLIRILPESSLRYEQVVGVIDLAQQSGFRRVVLGESTDERDVNLAFDPAVPNEADQVKIAAEIKKIYQADYARTERADLAALAKKLRQAGNDCEEDPAARFVLLREAARLAARAENVPAALAAIDDQLRW